MPIVINRFRTRIARIMPDWCKAFAAWIARKFTSADNREDVTFDRSIKLGDIAEGRLANAYQRMDKQDEKIERLQVQNAEQAAQMNVMKGQIDECREKHQDCEEKSTLQEAKIAGLQMKVANMETKLLPGPT